MPAAERALLAVVGFGAWLAYSTPTRTGSWCWRITKPPEGMKRISFA